MTTQIRVVLVDDHDLVLRALAAGLQAEPGINVVGTAMTIEEGLRAALDTIPDVVVIDYWLPDGDGADGARQLIDALPGLRVIMLTGRDDDTARAQAFDAGCCAFVAKGARLDELARAVRKAVVDGPGGGG